MATAAGGTDNERDISISDSLSNMSDELQEMFCEQCEKEVGNLVSAGGYCEKCLVYMCSTCLRYHKTYKPQHSIQDKAHMPQDFCFQKCQDHPKELIKFYCNSCKQMACTVCKTRNHNNCIIAYIPSLVKSTNLETEVKELVKEIDNTLAINTNSIDEISSKCLEIEEVCENAKSSIKKHKIELERKIGDHHHKSVFNLQKKHEKDLESNKKMQAYEIDKLNKEKIELLKQLEKKMEDKTKYLKQQEKELIYKHHLESKTLQDKQKQAIAEIEKREKELLNENENVVQEDKTRLTTLCLKAKTTKAQLENLKHDLCEEKKSNRKCEIFLAVRRAENQMEKLKTAAKEESKCGRINRYVFTASYYKITEVNTQIRFGSLVEKSKKMRLIYKADTEINVAKMKNEKCSITGLCKISDTHLIAADNANSSIKMIDTAKELTTAVLPLEDKPFDVTLVENNTVAVTMPNARQIQLISSETQINKLSFSSKISVQGECFGIAFKKPNLIVGCQGNVQLLGLDGTVIETIYVNQNVRDLCQVTRLHLNGDELYVLSNLKTSKTTYLILLEISVDSKITEKKDSEQKTLGGVFESLTGDKEGTIFLASRYGYEIIQLSSDLKTSHSHNMCEKEYMFKPSEYMFKIPEYKPPKALFYCNKEKKLYAGTEGSFILVYDVS